MKLPRDIDQGTRDLLQCIFNVDPNLRITIKEIMKKSFYKDTNWERVRERDFDSDEIPFKQSSDKHHHLLFNSYPQISNLLTIADEKSELGSATSPQKRLLGDFTLYKVNKELEHF